MKSESWRIDRNLRRYGPETEDARAKLRTWANLKKQQLFPTKGEPSPSSRTTIVILESVQDAIIALTPHNEKQTYLRTLSLSLSSTLIQTRWSLETRNHQSTPLPFLVLLIFWLAIVFASFGLFAPANPTTVTILLLCSIAVSGGIVLIEELDHPISGLIRIPDEAMRKAVLELDQ